MSLPPYNSYMPTSSPSPSRHQSPSMDASYLDHSFLTTNLHPHLQSSPLSQPSRPLSRSSSLNSQHSQPANKPLDPLEAASLTAAASPTVLPWPSCYLPTHHAQNPTTSSYTIPVPIPTTQQLTSNYFGPLSAMSLGLGMNMMLPPQQSIAIPPSMQYTAISPPREFCLPPSAFERQSETFY